jgi:hypothetical protein
MKDPKSCVSDHSGNQRIVIRLSKTAQEFIGGALVHLDFLSHAIDLADHHLHPWISTEKLAML